MQLCHKQTFISLSYIEKTQRRLIFNKQSISVLPLRTLLQYSAKILVVARAVPAAVPELVLALPDAQPGPFSHLANNLWLSLTQFSLLPSQTLCLPANGVGVHHQWTAHSPGNVQTMSVKRREQV